jgi:hypothetical protein
VVNKALARSFSITEIMMRINNICLLLFGALSICGTADAQGGFDPRRESLRRFQAYKPTIERTEGATVDNPQAFVGDLNGDGRADCIVFFVMTPKGGGNAIVGRKAAVYMNTGSGMKVDGAFPDMQECYAVDRVSGGRIYLSYYECAPPYMTKTGSGVYTWSSGKLLKAR